MDLNTAMLSLVLLAPSAEHVGGEPVVQVQASEAHSPADSVEKKARTDEVRARAVKLRSHVMANWTQPANSPDLRYPCRADVIIDRAGQVESVAFSKPCGAALEKSIEEAIRGSTPLPVMQDPRLFTRNLILNFFPRDQVPTGPKAR
jgi:hypothetical protein